MEIQDTQTTEIKYTECQKNALARVVEVYNAGKIRYFGLYGGGGVGKTFIADTIVRTLLDLSGDGKKALILAPTNSAVKSIRRSFGLSAEKMIFKTIHSALGIQPDQDEHGKLVFNKKLDTDWDYPVVFIDEASMVGKNLSSQLLRKIDQSGAFLIASGDRPQLPPVGEDSSALMDAMEDSYTLNEIVRQKGSNPISTVILHTRNAVESGTKNYDPRDEFWESMHSETKEGYYVFYDDNSGINQIVKAYCKAYERKKFDLVKLGAYTNRQCKKHNDYIRHKLWGAFAEKEYIPGDLVMCKSPVTVDSWNPAIQKKCQYTVMTAGTECLVESVTSFTKVFKERILNWCEEIIYEEPKYVTHEYKGWRLSVRDNDPLYSQVEPITVDVIDQVDKPRYLANQDRMRTQCKEFYDQLRKNVWYIHNSHLELFHNFTHSYCITIHSTQGKTYDAMGIDIADIINSSRDTDIRNKLIYVGASRAKKFLILI